MRTFEKVTGAFNYIFSEKVSPKNEFIIAMPTVSTHKKSVNDIGYTADDEIALFSTIAANPYSEDCMWQEIQSADEINKTTTYIKVINESSSAGRVFIRVIMN